MGIVLFFRCFGNRRPIEIHIVSAKAQQHRLFLFRRADAVFQYLHAFFRRHAKMRVVFHHHAQLLRRFGKAALLPKVDIAPALRIEHDSLGDGIAPHIDLFRHF